MTMAAASLFRRLLFAVVVSAVAPLLHLFSEASAEPTGIIQGRLRLPHEDSLPTTRITLNGGDLTTYSRPDGSFAFYNVGPGVHVLDVHSTIHHFGQVKVQLVEDAMDGPKCVEYAFPGAPKQAVPHPLILTAYAGYDYFEKRQGFSFLSILKNPMLLMMMFSVGLMFLMPKMMENLDPEQKEQMKKQMEMQQDPTKMLSQLWGDITGAADGDGAAADVPQSKSRGGKAGGKNARRLKRE